MRKSEFPMLLCTLPCQFVLLDPSSWPLVPSERARPEWFASLCNISHTKCNLASDRVGPLVCVARQLQEGKTSVFLKDL